MTLGAEQTISAGPIHRFRAAGYSEIHVLPVGEFLDERGDRLIVIDDLAISALLDSYTLRVEQPHLRPPIVDVEHSFANLDGFAPACGWVQYFKARPSGLWATVAWTSRGADLVQGGEYAFASPGFSFTETDSAQPKDATGRRRCRPALIDHISLTNRPFFQTLSPIDGLALINPGRSEC